jgi:hypothetical protein
MSNELQVDRRSMLHVRFDGRSFDVDMDTIDVGALSSDDDIRRAIAEHLSVPVSKLQAFAIDRNAATGDMTLRPEAVFA